MADSTRSRRDESSGGAKARRCVYLTVYDRLRRVSAMLSITFTLWESKPARPPRHACTSPVRKNALRAMRACRFWLPWLAASTLPLRAYSTTVGGLRASRREEGTNQVGHIFVMNTDVRFLACDAWLCPVSETMELSPHWERSIRACELPERPHDWGTSTSGSTTGTRVVRCLPRTEAALRRRREQRYKQYEHPAPYLALVMGRGLTIAQRAQTLHEFLNKVAEELPHMSRFGRALPLVAVPI